MVNDQEWFNKEYPKERKEIKIRLKRFQGPLVIDENYSNLKDLCLQNIKNVEQVILKNLPRLQNCEIWNCGLQDLIIENCPQLKTLNLCSNSLTNSGFLANLENLEKLELEDNAKLAELAENLKDYQGNWKIYKKFLDLQKENEGLKESKHQLKEFLKKEVINPLDESIKKAERKGSFSEKKTGELMTITKEEIEKVKEIKEGLEIKLTESGSKIQELENKLKEKQKEITYLSSQLQEQGEKIFNAYKYCVTELEEKELLDKLIKERIELVKFKKQEFDAEDYYEKSKEGEKKIGIIEEKLKEKLKVRLGEDKKVNKTMSEITRILTECEKMADQQLELRISLNDKVSLIESQKKILLQIPDNEEKIHQLELELAEIKGQLKVYQEKSSKPTQQVFNFSSASQQVAIGDKVNQSNQIICQINYNDQQFQKEREILRQNYQTFDSTNEPPSDPQKLKKTILFLGAKQILATTRQNTINKLIDLYEQQDKSDQKFTKFDAVGKYISSAGWIADFIPTPGSGAAVNLLGQGISAIASFFKQDALAGHAQEFTDYLIEDQKATFLLDKTYQSLHAAQNNQSKISPIIANLLKLNQSQLDQHDVFKVSKLQKDENLTKEKMEAAIEALKQHFENFTQELKVEAEQLLPEIEKLFTEDASGTLQTEITELLQKLVGEVTEPKFTITSSAGLPEQIAEKEAVLQGLINSAKEKLKSNSKFSESKRQEREEKLNLLFDNLPDTSKEFIKDLNSIKSGLSEKLISTEIDNLYQTKQKLAELRSQQQIQQQSQILQSTTPSFNPNN